MSIETHPDFGPRPAVGSGLPDPWERVVRQGLAARKIAATDAEIRRFIKTLKRLEASAEEAVCHTRPAKTGASAAQEFATTLQALGHD